MAALYAPPRGRSPADGAGRHCRGADYRGSIWAIRAARVFDGERFVARPTVLVDGPHIVAAGEPIPETVDVIDLPDSTVLPGLVDCHQHLCFDGNGTLEEQVSGIDDASLRARAHDSARRALAGGVTTLRDLGDRRFITLDLRGRSDLPTILAAGPPITAMNGHCWYLGGECSCDDALLEAVRERDERGCDVVKVMVTGGALTPTFPMWESQFTLEQLRLIVDEAHQRGLPVAAHCHGIEGIEMALAAHVDSIEHCTFVTPDMTSAPTDSLLERLATSGIALSVTWGETPDRPPPLPHIVAIRPIVREAMRRIHAAGGVVVVGTDAGINPYKPHDILPWAMETFAEAGIGAIDALRAITSAAAKACGQPSKGSLRAGADADLVAVAGDPLVDRLALTRIEQVWKAGHPVVSNQP